MFNKMIEKQKDEMVVEVRKAKFEVFKKEAGKIVKKLIIGTIASTAGTLLGIKILGFAATRIPEADLDMDILKDTVNPEE